MNAVMSSGLLQKKILILSDLELCECNYVKQTVATKHFKYY